MPLEHRDRQPARRPDASFATVVGVYVALLVVALWGFLGWTTVDGTGWPVDGVRVVGVIALVFGTIVATRIEGLAERLGRTSWAWALVGMPFLFQVPLYAGTQMAVRPASGAVTVTVLGSSFAAVIVGCLVVLMARNRHATWRLTDAALGARWSASWPARWRGRLAVLAGGFVVATGITVVVDSALTRGTSMALHWIALVLSIWIVLTSRRYRYRATDRGLAVRSSSVSLHVFDWSAFDGYCRTDDAIVLSRPEPWFPSIRCARSAIEDPEAVAASLDAHLARLG